MKKFLLAAMTLSIMMSGTAVFAEEPAEETVAEETATEETTEEETTEEGTNSLNWEDVEPILEAGEVNGDFHTFDEIDVKIWLPEGCDPVELTDEDKENGYIGYFMPEDESAAVAVVYVDVNGMSLEEYAEYLASEDDVAEVEAGTVNGFPCVTYKMPENDSMNITFTTEAGYALEVTCTPASEENAELVWGVVMASIQPAS